MNFAKDEWLDCSFRRIQDESWECGIGHIFMASKSREFLKVMELHIYLQHLEKINQMLKKLTGLAEIIYILKHHMKNFQAKNLGFS